MNKRPAFKRVKIFLTDVDGVLTDGGVFVGKGEEFKCFNVLDGMGMRLLQHLGVPVGWVSNRESAATTARAKELKVDYLWQKSLPKVAATFVWRLPGRVRYGRLGDVIH